jgi:hypothetical protein
LEVAQILSADFINTIPDKANTRVGMPWVLVIKFDVSSRKEAMTLERKIKKRGIQRFLDQAK